MNDRRVALVAGARTPFVKSRTAFAGLGPLELAKRSVLGLLDRCDVDPELVQTLAFGAVVPERGKPNLARELVLEAGLPASIDAQTISSYCITGLRTIASVADAIAQGRIDAGIAGGVEWLSGADPTTFIEPTTGLSMGQHTEMTAKAFGVPRSRQDEIALASHRRAVAGREVLAAEIVAVSGIEHDSGPRVETSLDALGRLKAVFATSGTITAGNASPVTDGASAVLLMSAARARSEGLEPLAYIRAIEFGSIHPTDGLLMAPAVVVPRLLAKTSLRLSEMDLIEMHEAFGAQVVANAMAWEQGWRADPIGPVDWARVNVRGSSIALGHPWSATGGRIVTTLAHEMVRRDARFGLVSICAAGAMAGAMLLERS